MKVTIETGQNGAWALFDSQDPEEIIQKRVYEYGEDSSAGFLNLLWELLDEIGPPNKGRYSRERVVIKTEHGDKYVCELKGCELCKDAE